MAYSYVHTENCRFSNVIGNNPNTQAIVAVGCNYTDYGSIFTNYSSGDILGTITL